VPNNSVKVTFDDLHTTSSDLSAGSTTIGDELTRLKTKVDNLVSLGWNGAASDAFGLMYTSWQTSAGQLRDALDGISGMLGTAATAYQQTESDLTAKMQG
jgi:WXG100 family type VII secretion target